MSKIAVIGSGFAGLSAAAYLSKAGHNVHVIEKNSLPGGRARQFHTGAGYVFDMGPSWYWMPGVFEKFFSDFGYKVSELYELRQLDPAFDVVFPDGLVHIPSDYSHLENLFESLEKGSAKRLAQFMKEAEYKYKTGIENLVYKPGLSYAEFIDADLFKGVFRLQVFSSFSKHVRKYFSHPYLIALMEFPVLFLGAMPQDTPALYSLMNYAGLKLGTWYPMGGFGKVIDAMIKVNEQLGTSFLLNSPVEKISISDHKATGVVIGGEHHPYDAVISGADYHHTEQALLPETYRNYKANYWDKKVFAPSCLIYYIGISKRIKSLHHHTLFFDEDLHPHSLEIYKTPKWPSKPLFYVCCPSRTDPDVAPEGHENLFLLMPIAPGLEDNELLRHDYFDIMMSRLENQVGEDLRSCVDYCKSYCVNDFVQDYNAYKGNAYGLANTLMQTATLKPKIKNKKIENLFYTGQLTVPGPGVPPSIISGEVSASLLHKYLKDAKQL